MSRETDGSMVCPGMYLDEAYINCQIGMRIEKSFFVSGISTLHGELSVHGVSSFDDTLRVSGTTTLNGITNVNGIATISNTLAVSGNTTLYGSLSVVDEENYVTAGIVSGVLSLD